MTLSGTSTFEPARYWYTWQAGSGTAPTDITPTTPPQPATGTETFEAVLTSTPDPDYSGIRFQFGPSTPAPAVDLSGYKWITVDLTLTGGNVSLNMTNSGGDCGFFWTIPPGTGTVTLNLNTPTGTFGTACTASLSLVDGVIFSTPSAVGIEDLTVGDVTFQR
jgi:hypothetical protein